MRAQSHLSPAISPTGSGALVDFAVSNRQVQHGLGTNDNSPETATELKSVQASAAAHCVLSSARGVHATVPSRRSRTGEDSGHPLHNAPKAKATPHQARSREVTRVSQATVVGRLCFSFSEWPELFDSARQQVAPVNTVKLTVVPWWGATNLTDSSVQPWRVGSSACVSWFDKQEHHEHPRHHPRT